MATFDEVQDINTLEKSKFIETSGGNVALNIKTEDPLDVAGTVSINEPVSVDDNGGSITVDDGGTTLSIDDGGSSITIDGGSTQGMAAVRVFVDFPL